MDSEKVNKKQRWRIRGRRYRIQGPNYVLHNEDYDKLKPYRISIRWCIDGYSSCIIWLEDAASSKVPELIAKYHLDYVKKIKLKPKTINADDGTGHLVSLF